MQTPRVSFVIPVLNEVDFLRGTIDRLREALASSRAVYEIIVADSGSTDGTLELARDLSRAGDLRIFSDAKVTCRAEACNNGAARAQGAIFVFLDADTLVPDGFLEKIESVLSDPDIVAGAFEFKLAGRGFALRVIELVNRIRYRFWQRYYGDQALFVRAAGFRAVGGFPPRKILESSDLCRALREVGRLRLVRTPVLTSARRFTDGGVWRVFGRDIGIWLLDTLGVATDEYGAPYWSYNTARGHRDPPPVRD